MNERDVSPQEDALEAVRKLADRLTEAEDALRVAVEHRSRLETNLRAAEELLVRCPELEWLEAHDLLFSEIHNFTVRRDLYD